MIFLEGMCLAHNCWGQPWSSLSYLVGGLTEEWPNINSNTFPTCIGKGTLKSGPVFYHALRVTLACHNNLALQAILHFAFSLANLAPVDSALVPFIGFSCLEQTGLRQQSQFIKTSHKAKKSHEQHQRIFWTIRGGCRSVPSKSRVSRQIVPESSPERSAKSLSQSFIVLLFCPQQESNMNQTQRHFCFVWEAQKLTSAV